MLASDHAVARAMQRHGIVLHAADAAKLVLDIIDAVDGRASRARMQSRCPHRGTEVWVVEIDGRPLRVAYSPVSATIVTVLP